jgi:hypothetical protein
VEGSLRRSDDGLFLGRKVGREIFPDAFLADREVAVRVLEEGFQALRIRIFRGSAFYRLALVRRVGRHVHERFDLVVISGFGNDGTAPRMADEDDRAVRVPDCPLGRGDVVVQ